VFRVHRRPGPGETAIGDGFGMFLGGKGFNQAVAARRLGADVTFVGRCGADDFGHRFTDALKREGITASVTLDEEEGTAVACPTVDARGENSIIVVPRANRRLSSADVERARPAIEAADVLMLQFEVNLAASRRAAEIARAAGTAVLLDPAPAEHDHGESLTTKTQRHERHQEGALTSEAKGQKPNVKSEFLDRSLIGGIEADVLVPNEHEAAVLAHSDNPADWPARLLRPSMKTLVVSLGEAGAAVFDAQGRREFPAFVVDAVDSTGAGDAFRAGLAVRLAEGADTDAAVRFANACGALACTVLGAEPSMPHRAAVEALLR
ncbi:MAG: ribokinase, partial [bacterium]